MDMVYLHEVSAISNRSGSLALAETLVVTRQCMNYWNSMRCKHLPQTRSLKSRRWDREKGVSGRKRKREYHLFRPLKRGCVHELHMYPHARCRTRSLFLQF